MQPPGLFCFDWGEEKRFFPLNVCCERTIGKRKIVPGLKKTVSKKKPAVARNLMSGTELFCNFISCNYCKATMQNRRAVVLHVSIKLRFRLDDLRLVKLLVADLWLIFHFYEKYHQDISKRLVGR
ncbi:hypothetical protein TMES_15150 [Thalassospira mesophila]|uniref:Uncharacterized protein n=1 Tax=Thalassospira mesophila TaxID=1293891 RepID=A0A1Y2KXM1_9PROT|nr:hypothetical protein TMES_15150 [Thalassospira mesophila]